jgi:hypothetical protein
MLLTQKVAVKMLDISSDAADFAFSFNINCPTARQREAGRKLSPPNLLKDRLSEYKSCVQLNHC